MELFAGLPYPSYRLLVLGAGVLVALLLYLLVNHSRVGMLVRAGVQPLDGRADGVRVTRIFSGILCWVRPWRAGGRAHGAAGGRAGGHGRIHPDPGAGGHRHRRHWLGARGLVAAMLVGLVDTIGRAFCPLLLRATLPRPWRPIWGPCLPKVSMYALMAAVLAFALRGCFLRKPEPFYAGDPVFLDFPLALESRRMALAILLAAGLVSPVAAALGLDFYIGFVRRVLVVALAAASLNFIMGFGGMVALGHAGFMGVGPMRWCCSAMPGSPRPGSCHLRQRCWRRLRRWSSARFHCAPRACTSS